MTKMKMVTFAYIPMAVYFMFASGVIGYHHDFVTYAISGNSNATSNSTSNIGNSTAPSTAAGSEHIYRGGAAAGSGGE
jgi:hypothetical protein